MEEFGRVLVGYSSKYEKMSSQGAWKNVKYLYDLIVLER